MNIQSDSGRNGENGLLQPAWRGSAWDCQGFTLLEIMLATLILALVVSMITLSLSSSLNVMEATRDQGEIYFRAQVALERISDDLASAVLPEQADFVARTADSAEQDKPVLSFVSTAHVLLDPVHDHAGMATIAYAVRPDPDEPETFVLLRGDRLLVPVDAQARENQSPDYYLLSDRLRSVRFVYLDQQGEEMESWDTRVDDNASQQQRDEARRLPFAVRCQLEYWLDREAETSLVFQTMIELPVGRIHVIKQAGI